MGGQFRNERGEGKLEEGVGSSPPLWPPRCVGQRTWESPSRIARSTRVAAMNKVKPSARSCSHNVEQLSSAQCVSQIAGKPDHVSHVCGEAIVRSDDGLVAVRIDDRSTVRACSGTWNSPPSVADAGTLSIAAVDGVSRGTDCNDKSSGSALPRELVVCGTHSGAVEVESRSCSWRDRGCDYRSENGADYTPAALTCAAKERNDRSSRRRRARSLDVSSSFESDPPSRLIRNFLQRQSELGAKFLDLDMDMDELAPNGGTIRRAANGVEKETRDPPPPSLYKLPKEAHPRANGASKLASGVLSSSSSFTSSEMSSPRGVRHPESPPSPSKKAEIAVDILQSIDGEAAVNGGGMRSRKTGGVQQPEQAVAEGDEVLKSPISYSRPTFSRLKSRLMDLPKPQEQPKSSEMKGEEKKSGPVRASRELRSGMPGKLIRIDEEDDDPLKDADLPERYRKRDKGFLHVMQWIAFFIIVGGIITIVSFPKLKSMKRGGLMLWKWALLVLVVFSGRLVSGWIIWFIVIIIEMNFLLRKRVLYFVYALRKGVQNCLWLAFALLAWHLMVDPKVNKDLRVVTYVTKILQCFLIGAVIVLVKTLLVKVFASSFHVSNFFERIQEALFNQYIMETLSGPPFLELHQNYEEDLKLQDEVAGLRKLGAEGPQLPTMSPVNMKSGMVGTKDSSQILNQSGQAAGGKSAALGKPTKAENRKSQKLEEERISVDHLTKLDQRNISAWNMKRLVNIIRNSSLTHSIEETVSETQGVETEIQSEWQAKKAAKLIFRNVAKPKARVIREDDLMRFMREEEAKRALTLFEGAVETKTITRQALKCWLVNVYRERRALALSLNDTKTAVNKLHRIVNVVVGVVVVIIWLLVLNIATTQLLLFTSSQFLLVILVWGNTLKTVLEAIVFLFVMHPFDVGDRCCIDGQQLVVEEMNILTTVFMGDFNVKIWYPNSVLATKPIHNYYRSPEMGDVVEFLTLNTTPLDKIESLKESIGKYLSSKPQFWHPEYTLNVMEMTEAKRMKMALGVKHTMNWQDLGERFRRKSELLLEVKSRCAELGVEYRPPVQEMNVNVKPIQE